MGTTAWPTNLTKQSSTTYPTSGYTGIAIRSYYNLGSISTNSNDKYARTISIGGLLHSTDYINLDVTNYTLKVTGQANQTGSFTLKNINSTKNTTSSNTIQAFSKLYSFTKTHSAQTITVTLKIQHTGNSPFSSTVQGTFSIPAKTSYTVKFDPNGGTGSISNYTKWYKENLSLPTTGITKDNHKFLGWNEDKNAGTGTFTYTSDKNVTLYAIWKPLKYNIKYNFNGGTATINGSTLNSYEVSNISYSDTHYIGSQNQSSNSDYIIPTRQYYNFEGWSTLSTGNVNYNVGDQKNKLAESGTITLYAVWSSQITTIPTLENIVSKRCGAGGVENDEGEYGMVNARLIRGQRTIRTWDTTINPPTSTTSTSVLHTKVEVDIEGGNQTDSSYIKTSITAGDDIETYDSSVVLSPTVENFSIIGLPGAEGKLSTEYKFDLTFNMSCYYYDSNLEPPKFVEIYLKTEAYTDSISKAFFIIDINATGTAMGFGTSVTDSEVGYYFYNGGNIYFQLDTEDSSSIDYQIDQLMSTLGWTEVIE